MVSRRHLYRLLVLLLALSLILMACERPVPGSDETDADMADTTSEVGTDTSQTGEESGSGDAVDAEPEPEADSSTDAEDATPRDEIAEEEAAPADEAEAEEPAEGSAADEPKEVEETPAEESAETGEDAEAEEAESADDSEGSEPTAHEVAVGENLYRIGLMYNVSWVTLAEYNEIDNANDVVVGQVLKIPPQEMSEEADEPEEAAEAESETEEAPAPPSETTYTVKVGDNLYRIGLLYGISWIQIAEANGLVSPNQILVGQVLKIPADTPGPAPQFTHEVKPGETLFTISLQYGVAWPAIAEANDLDSPYVIYNGQTLVIPGG